MLFVTTSLGLQVPLLHPKPHDIKLRDIAHHLACINRFCGAPAIPFTVAQHSIVVAKDLERQSPRLGLLGLLHDGHEYVLGDMITPVKRAHFGDLPLPTERDALEDGLDRAIHGNFGIAMPDPDERMAIARADQVALATEWRDLMPEGTACPVTAPPAPRRIIPWPWHKAEEQFLKAFDRLAVLNGIKGPEVTEGSRL